jgi:putative transposase
VGRPDRVQVPGFHHVFSRGAGGVQFFVDDDDRQHFLQLLGRTADTLQWTVFAYCLMTTHYHAVIRTRNADLSRGMQQVNSMYVRSFNAKWDRFGTLVASRFGSRVIESEEYLADVCRYVFLNPVQAKLCRRASDWPWSGGEWASAMSEL